MIFFLFFLPISSIEANCDLMPTIRTTYYENKTEQQLEEFIQLLNEMDCEEAQPYLASAIMQKAEYVFLPTSKLKYFNRGKKLLERFIEYHPNNLEARYVRVLVQSEIPSILGYKDSINSDVVLIKSQIKNSKLPSEYQKVILSNIKKIIK